MNIRPMTMNDADKMLEFKNYEETRRYAIVSHDIIKKEDHYKWLEKNLQYFQVFEEIYGDYDLNVPVICGILRIQNGEVSIWVGAEYWKQGRATFILQHHTRRGMNARIVEGNVGSMKAFIRAGFEPVHYVNASTCNYYIYKKW